MSERLYGREEIAKRLGVSLSALKRLETTEHVPEPAFVVRKRPLWTLAQIEAIRPYEGTHGGKRVASATTDRRLAPNRRVVKEVKEIPGAWMPRIDWLFDRSRPVYGGLVAPLPTLDYYDRM